MNRIGSKVIVFVATILLGIIASIFIILYFNLKDNTSNLNLAGSINNEFLTNFFDYNETSERYTSVKEIMSEKGYQLLFPSGISMPTSEIKSRLSDLTVYQDPKSSEKPEFISTFSVETTFQGVSSKENMVLRTKFRNLEGKWLVDDMEILADVPSDEE